MKTSQVYFASSVVALLGLIATLASFTMQPKTKNSAYSAKSIYDFTLNTIDGKPISLSQFKGKKMLLVNVASQCGYTPQYKDLEALHKKYKDKLVVIGFPANNFGSQEPGSNAEISSFCQKNYGVSFLMMEKISVKGNDMHPLYKWLSTKEDNGVCNDAPGWNFCKYLIDEKGNVIQFFKSSVNPLSEDITSKL
ncbi:MAG: glutathione peroxidase [Bacteroidia bacterium]|jgi:glutathione peroxidase|nr:glutathione peroxidase [Bacteroidia bacterium]